MPNGHDKQYRVIEIGAKTAEDLRVELNQAEADGFGQWRGVNEKFIFLYQGKQK